MADRSTSQPSAGVSLPAIQSNKALSGIVVPVTLSIKALAEVYSLVSLFAFKNRTLRRPRQLSERVAQRRVERQIPRLRIAIQVKPSVERLWRVRRNAQRQPTLVVCNSWF